MNQNLFSWQQKDYEKLCRAFAAGSKILLIHGKDFESPYHVMSSLYTQLSQENYKFLGVYSDSSCLSYPYLPFTRAANNAFVGDPSKKSLLPSIVKDITRLDTAVAIVEHIIHKRHSSITLNDRENELLLHLECAANGSVPIFLIYGFSNFDEISRKLTVILLSGQLDEAFPFLRKSRFLFLCETEDDSSFVLQHIKLFEHVDVHLASPQPDNISEILTEICPQFNFLPEDQDRIFHLSGGRLSVIEILSHHLQNKGHSLTDQSVQDAVSNTLAERISKMGESGIELESILAFAANIGNTFHIPLLKKATEPISCELVLKRGEDEYFTKCNGETGRFVCHEIWNYFNSCASEDRRQEIAKIIERAIYYFDPYDYLTRAHYLEQAGLICDACELYILAYNSIYLEGIVPDNSISTKIATLVEQCGIRDYWNNLNLVYSSLNDLDYDTCVYLLEDMMVPSSKRLLLLKEYMIGLCLHKLGQTSDQQQEAMISMKMAAEHAYNFEEGIWCDCQTALISLWMNATGNITAAKQAWKELTYYYTEKGFSAFAQKGLHALGRKWGAIFSVERAVPKTEESVKYFRNGLYPAQYLMALNNHAANLILLNRNAEAMSYFNEAFSLLEHYPNIPVNQMYLLNNYILCAVLNGELEPKAAHQKLLPIVSEKEFGDWMIIFELNCAIYMALSGDIADAEKSLRELEQSAKEINDDYYLFYVYANLAAVLYLQGKRTEAVQMLKTQCSKAPVLFKAAERVHAEARTKKWISVMETEVIEDPKAFDSFLLEDSSVHAQWQFWEHGFLYSDIQFWSEG